MSEYITSASPRPVFRGINDKSRRRPLLEPYVLPDHCPLLFGFAERGPTNANLVVGDAATSLYGLSTFQLRSKYATHQTPFVDVINGNGNSFFFKRLKPTDANPAATMALWVDKLVKPIPQYERTEEGFFVLDSDNQKIPLFEADGTTPLTEMGTSVYYFWEQLPHVNSDGEVITQDMIDDYNAGDLEINIIPVANLMGQASTRVGTRTEGLDTSVQECLGEWEVNFFGSYGSNVGMRLSCGTALSTTPVDTDVVNDVGSMLYRMQLVERDVATSTALVQETVFGEQTYEFSFKPGAINQKVSKDIYFDDTFMPTYQDLETPGWPPLYGPFGRFHIYRDNMEDFLREVYTTEVAADANFPEYAEGLEYMINFASGVAVTGVPYRTLEILGQSAGGIVLSEFATHYATGGTDGTMTFDTFDDLVAKECENFGDLEDKFLNWAKYPISCLYDSGFTLATKRKMLVPMGRRQNIWVYLGTQDVSSAPNTISDDSSTAIALNTAARLFPESNYYGTPVCRAIVVSQCGKLLSSEWKEYVPLTYELAKMHSRYMGAGNGIWASEYNPSGAPGNWVTSFRDVNNTFKPSRTQSYDWSNGMVWAQDYDHLGRLFFPAVQTVYNDDSSVLNSAINMIICATLQMICFRAWSQLTGIDYLTEDQFIERSNELIMDLVRYKFDNRVIIEVDTFFSDADRARGYSWSCKVKVGMPSMYTVGDFTVESYRMADLLAQQAA